MHPLDLADEMARRDRRDRRLLASDLRQAALNSTPAELMQLQQIRYDVRAGHLAAPDARTQVNAMREQQRQRATLPPSG